MTLATTSKSFFSSFDPRSESGRKAIFETAEIVDIFRNGFPRSTDADIIQAAPQSSANPTTKQGDSVIEKGQPIKSALNSLKGTKGTVLVGLAVLGGVVYWAAK